jgi:hypothetical protein
MEGPVKIAGAGADDTILRVENLASPRSVFSAFLGSRFKNWTNLTRAQD